jgi:hypothetical protein
MELYVFSNTRLASIVEWQAAIDAEKFDLQLSNEIALSEVDGFLPASLHGRPTGFECSHWDAGELIAGLKADSPDIHLEQPWKFVLAFRWLGSKLDEAVAAYAAAGAYARATGGAVFDCEAAKLVDPDEAMSSARDLEQFAPEVEKMAFRIVDEVKKKSQQ